MPERRAPARRVSELQSAAPRLVREAQRNGALALTRYGKTIAYLVSPQTHERQEELEQAANRALWAIDIQRGLRDLKAGDLAEWDEIHAALMAEFGR